ncbi:MAG: hypothetical protein FADNKDHG_01472 [Holosporales bacterium]
MKVICIAVYSNRQAIKISKGKEYDSKEYLQLLRWFKKQGNLQYIKVYNRDTGQQIDFLKYY